MKRKFNRTMKLNVIKPFAALAAVLIVSHYSRTFAQGSLTPPPGAPAPVMKTLGQIEPRIVMNTVAGSEAAMHVIHQPGHYYLTGDITATAGKHAIQVNAHNVTIDLNGFTIIGTGEANRAGITLLDDDGGDGANLTVRNGHFRNWGGGAIQYFSHSAGIFEDLQIRGCRYGIALSKAFRISRCQVSGEGVGRGGIVLTTGISTVEDCLVEGISSLDEAFGIRIDRGIVKACVINGISGGTVSRGIFVESSDALVSQCNVIYVNTSGGQAIGIEAAVVQDCSVSGVRGYGGASRGVGVLGRHVERCSVMNTIAGPTSGSATGIRAKDSSGLIQQCFIDGATAAAAIGIDAGTNRCGIINSKVSNISGAGVNSYGIRSEAVSSSIKGCDVSSITNSTGYAWGIYIQGGLVERCNVSLVRNDGIYANGQTTVSNCRVSRAGNGALGVGIWASSTRNNIDGNHITECDTGIQVYSGSSASVTRNICQDNTSNYFVPGASVAPIVNAAGAAAATNPLANLSL